MSVLRSSAIVSSLTMVSRVFGFIREMVIANKLGASSASDALFVAMMLPNLLRRLFAEGAFNVVFVPILSRIEEKHGDAAAATFASKAYSLLAYTLLAITLICEYFMPQIVAYVISPGWDNPEQLAFATLLSRITFPYLMLITFASLAGGILGTYGRFAPFALTPVFLNITMIIGMLTLPLMNIDAATAGAISMTLGGIIQWMYMQHALKQLDFKLKLTKDLGKEDPNMHSLFRRFGPAALGIGILQISFLIDMHLASYLEGNAISYLQFANRFYQQPLALIGIALSTVLLPHLSRALKAQNAAEANKLFSDALVYAFALAAACCIGLYAMAYELIDVLFGHGKFDAADTLRVSQAMQAYCLSLPAFVITRVTLTCFYANEDTRTPLKISVVSLILNVIFNLILMQYFGFVGIAMATALAGWCNAALQLYLINRQGFIKPHDFRVFKKQVGKMLVIITTMAVTLGLFVTFIPAGSSTLSALLWMAALSALGLMIFVGLSHILQFFNIADTVKSILKRP